MIRASDIVNLAHILCVAASFAVSSVRASPPEVRDLNFFVPDVSQASVAFEVRFKISAAEPFEMEDLNIYTLSRNSARLIRRGVRGISFYGAVEDLGRGATSFSSRRRIPSGSFEMGVQISPTDDVRNSNSTLPLTPPGLRAGTDQWCFEFLPVFAGKLVCLRGPSFEEGQERAIAQHEARDNAKDRELAALFTANSPSVELCQLVGQAIPDSLRGQLQCRVNCGGSEALAVDEGKRKPSSPADCLEKCRRLTESQARMATQAFVVCDGIVDLPKICSLTGRMLQVCGVHSTPGCSELGRVVGERCDEKRATPGLLD